MIVLFILVIVVGRNWPYVLKHYITSIMKPSKDFYWKIATLLKSKFAKRFLYGVSVWLE